MLNDANAWMMRFRDVGDLQNLQYLLGAILGYVLIQFSVQKSRLESGNMQRLRIIFISYNFSF